VRHVETEHLRSLEVDRQLVLGRRLNRQVGRLVTPENAIDVAGRAPELINDIGPIGNQATTGDERALEVDGRQLVAAASAMISSR
jgi:hypothetical protein